MNLNNTDKLLSICEKALAWAKTRDYTGWEKHDALNSPMLRALSLGRKWPRILLIQGVMRSPINTRPIFGVKKHRNPKGVALFARANFNLYSITGNDRYLNEANDLLHWLLENPSKGFRGLSWGYPYPWQDPGFYAPADFPNRIVTYFAGRAMIHGYELTGDEVYLNAARQTVEFILSEPRTLDENETMRCLSYVPVPDVTMAVMDVSALCAALVAMVGKHTKQESLVNEACRLMNWVVDKQTDYGAWYYTHPAGDSHITHDNYHTGEILDSIPEYRMYSGDSQFNEAYEKGMEYYRANLFTQNARPKWMNDREYPYDIHGYSQGIITFALSGDLVFAERLIKAALEDMYCQKENRFYYQRQRWWTNKYTPMRWAQAWMTYAISCYLTRLKDSLKGTGECK